jgi:hypothetical protein
MSLLLDTCILIDYLRGKERSVDYLEGLGVAPTISVITVMELTAGAKGKREESQMAELFSAFNVIDVDRVVAEEAGRLLAQYARSHAVDPPDALIAATARCHDLDLVTHNIKHFPMFKGLKRPYKVR